MRVIEFKAQHMIDLLAGGAIECGMRMREPNEVLQILAAERERSGLCVTLVDDDETVVGCSGLSTLHRGVVELWAMFSPQLTAHKVSACRAMREKLAQWMEGTHLHRIQTHVRMDFDKGILFAKFFGFKPEGVAEKYGPDEADYLTMALLKGANHG